MLRNMHRIRATSPDGTCTDSVHDVRGELHCNRATFAAQPCTVLSATSEPFSCTPSVQHTLHGCGASQDNRYRTTNPVMHYVQDGSNSLPLFMTTHFDVPDHQRNNRPRTRKGGADA